MHRALLLAAIAACACSGGGGGGGDAGVPGGDADGSGDAGGSGDAAGHDARPGDERSILYQCTAFGGGLCVMAADGSAPMTLHATGFAPRGLGDGSILFHTSSYRVARRAPGGAIDELGDGAFPRPAPGGRIVFQCSGLGGGICAMAADGSGRTTIRATGRVPDVRADGDLVFHSDDYTVSRKTSGGVTQLRAGANAMWW